MNSERPLAVVFFRTEAGNEPVREWLKGLPKEIILLHGFIKKTQKTRPPTSHWHKSG